MQLAKKTEHIERKDYALLFDSPAASGISPRRLKRASQKAARGNAACGRVERAIARSHRGSPYWLLDHPEGAVAALFERRECEPE